METRLEARGLTIWEPGKTAMSVAVVTQHHKEARRYAKLLAASAQMLEALRKAEPLGDSSPAGDIRAALRPHERERFDEIMSAIREAIAAAT